MADTKQLKGTVIQFVPKKYDQVPKVKELVSDYVDDGKELNDLKALGMVILDDQEKSHTFYATISFIANTLNRMEAPIKIRSRVALTYASVDSQTNVLQSIKKLPVFFEHNKDHDKDKDAPAFRRLGDANDTQAHPLVSFNPLLPVPSNINAKEGQATRVLGTDKVENLKDDRHDTKEVFLRVLKDSGFQDKTKAMFQETQQQTQGIIDNIFDKHYLDFVGDYNHVHYDDFAKVDKQDQDDYNNSKKKRKRPKIEHMKL